MEGKRLAENVHLVSIYDGDDIDVDGNDVKDVGRSAFDEQIGGLNTKSTENQSEMKSFGFIKGTVYA